MAATNVKFDNSGAGKLLVPGFNGISVDYVPSQRRSYDFGHAKLHFRHGVNDFRGNRLTVRELAMLQLMDSITDKPNWNVKVFNEDIVTKWRTEATENMPLISEMAWEWCLAELRDKAREFEITHRVLALDSNSRCAKSDVLVNADLRMELVAAVAPLLNVSGDQKDWHPKSNDQVLNLVHPSLFPLVYGKTRVLTQGGRVELSDSFSSCGKGEVAPVTGYVTSFWSQRFQWLPCDVEFVGESGTEVKITSYINNLHPEKHAGLYKAAEKLIRLSIPLWNDVLIKEFHGRTPQRIITYGGEMEPKMPDWAAYSSLPDKTTDENYAEVLEKVKEFLRLPERRREESSDEDEDDEDDEGDEEGGNDFGSIAAGLERRLADISENPPPGKRSIRFELCWLLDRKWKRIRKLAHPEPGTAMTYEEWKDGVQRAVQSDERLGRSALGSHLKFNRYVVNIEKDFRAKGLQVIVKLASIELTPDKPQYGGGSWHVEGMLNEHIVATAIYYYDVENVSEARIAFRQEAYLDEESLIYEQDEHKPLATTFGAESMRDEPAVQELGSIATPQGRLLVFPNTLQHCVAPFRLADPSKPGHRRFVVLWLVDPHYRICSTANVPPQRHDWWAEKGLGKINFGKLPQEVVHMVMHEVGDWPMGMDEAKKLRLELMEERTRMTRDVERNFEQYNLCEH